ncbi:hypothetical protein ACSNOU_18410 [Acinetobacter oleivorans]|uniref:hypothetical protein n=1 Tax=Acinetobacter oleivorans TaxID=1148157 RepID=UPI003F1CEAE0
MSFAQYFDFGLITISILFIGSCRFHLYKIMPLVTQALRNPANHNIFERNWLKILTNVPYAFICLVFIIWRFHNVLALYQVDTISSWIVPLLVGIYGAYVVFLHSTFILVAANAKPIAWRDGD